MNLKLTSKNKIGKTILNKKDFKIKHKNKKSLYSEINIISEYLKNIGYFTNKVDSVKKNKNDYTAYFSLKDKIDSAVIYIDKSTSHLLDKLGFKNKIIKLPINNLKSTLKSISNKIEKEGYSFSTIKLTNISIKNKTLFAELEIHQSKKRNINKIIIKGYNEFPKSFLKNYFNLKTKTVFNKKLIREISNKSNNLHFISEIKSPEILFKKDSTFLYLYVKKKPNNSFNGIINFSSKENGKLLFNGNIDLNLNNTFNSGEKFELFWNSIGLERQEFKLATELPYIFNSKISPLVSFSIYKQDSTFLNTKFDSKLFYSLNLKTKLALTYNAEKSEDLKELLNNNINSFNNYFWGINLTYNISKNDFFKNNKFLIQVNPSFGKRKTDINSSNQFKINSTVYYIWDISKRSSFYIKNEIGHLNSDTFLTNELFRIGGINSIRGFNEQSIYTQSYTILNLEYRYLTSEKSYLYSITDFGKTKSHFTNENLFGLGLGFIFTSNNSQINLATALGKSSQQSSSFKKGKIMISWKNFF